MEERSFDEMIAYFNRRVADMDINQDDKMELLGMVTALGFKHEKSVQPERKRGLWIEDGYNHYKAVCSECGEPCATYVMDAPRDRFCKWCGADMRCGNTE